MQQDAGLLFVSADPGCGKSVLARYLVDRFLPQSAPNATICYFFFKEQDQKTVRQALCALIHQLFSKNRVLIEHAKKPYQDYKDKLIHSTASLWHILRNSITDPRAGPVIVVLDALDECAESEVSDIFRNLTDQFHTGQGSKETFKYLLTSRPYEPIVAEFRDLEDKFSSIHIPGEDEVETISQEVNLVITHRVEELSKKNQLSREIQDHLETKLKEMTHRTYLWVYLVFDYLERNAFKRTKRGLETLIAQLPKSVNEAYEQILSKSNEDQMVRKALSIILMAARPLTIAEMNVAVNIESTSKFIHDLDLEEDSDFRRRLRSWCGLFVSIHHDKIYFLHQTAREFLLAKPASCPPPSPRLWYHSITAREGHFGLAEVCVRYLHFFNLDASRPAARDSQHHDAIYGHAFLDYAAKAWGDHFRDGDITDGALVDLALKISDPESESYASWANLYRHRYRLFPESFTSLMVASHFGHLNIVELLVDQGAAVDTRDERGRGPLSWAAERGHGAVIQLLLNAGADVDEQDEDGHIVQTPLALAAEEGHEAVVSLLLNAGATVDPQDSLRGQSPLSWAAEKGHDAIVQLLLMAGAEVDHEDRRYTRTPLNWAAQHGHEVVVQLLIDAGADVDTHDGGDEDDPHRTPLSWAVYNGHKAVVQLLLNAGADVDRADLGSEMTPLMWAAVDGDEAIVQELLKAGAAVDAQATDGWTPPTIAAANGHEAVVQLLLNAGAAIDAQNEDGQTPLQFAAANGQEPVVQLLLNAGATVHTQDNVGRTPLSWAAQGGFEAIIQLLQSTVNGHETDLGCS